MIFDGRPLDQIDDSEIAELVARHERERRSLEFKATINYTEDDDRAEALRDISSLANAVGGYLIVGIRDDGDGRAQKFSGLSEMDLQKIRHSIIASARTHIQETLDDITSDIRRPEFGHDVLMIRVAESVRKPHMVTFNNQTEFWTRYDDGKRQMSIAEIRDAFFQDRLERQMANLELGVGAIQDRLAGMWSLPEGAASKSLLEITDGNKLADAAGVALETELP